MERRQLRPAMRPVRNISIACGYPHALARVGGNRPSQRKRQLIVGYFLYEFVIPVMQQRSATHGTIVCDNPPCPVHLLSHTANGAGSPAVGSVHLFERMP